MLPRSVLLSGCFDGVGLVGRYCSRYRRVCFLFVVALAVFWTMLSLLLVLLSGCLDDVRRVAAPAVVGVVAVLLV